MADDILNRVEFLKAPPPPFPPKGGQRVSRREYVTHKKKETWMYTVSLLRTKDKAGGRIEVHRYDSTRPVGRASFDDMNEGESLFEEAWEEAQALTQEKEKELEAR